MENYGQDIETIELIIPKSMISNSPFPVPESAVLVADEYGVPFQTYGLPKGARIDMILNAMLDPQDVITYTAISESVSTMDVHRGGRLVETHIRIFVRPLKTIMGQTKVIDLTSETDPGDVSDVN